MRSFLPAFLIAGVALVSSCASHEPAVSQAVPAPAAIDGEVARAMAATGAKGLAIAVIEDGRVVSVKAYGARNAKGDPLQADTIMYGASLTKAAFAYMVMQLVDEGRLDLDTSIGEYLDSRCRSIPPRTSTRRGRTSQATSAGARSRRASCSPTARDSPTSPSSSPTASCASTSRRAAATPIRATASSCCSSCSSAASAWTSARRCSAACSTASACATPA